MVDNLANKKIKMNLKPYNLKNKYALITGGAGLMGSEHAAALLEIGAKIILTDLSMEDLENTKIKLLKDFPKGTIDLHVIDVCKEIDIISVRDIYEKKSETIEILINNAAINPKVGKSKIENTSRLENFLLEDWNMQLNVGLTGAFLCSKVFGFHMSRNNGGVILNIASDLSVIAPDQRLYKKDGIEDDIQSVKPVTYSVIKSGLIGLTRYLSTYWINQGVRCNSLSPGGIYNNQDPAFIEKIEKLIPMGRMADKNEYKSTVQYLCSDASKYMNGQNIVVDGGRSVW